ncbi:MAG: qcrB 2 [Myxococcales bacterium]|nr:qcrB 2 [Myxococcales bacterium]
MSSGLSRRQFCVVTGAGIVAGACGAKSGDGDGGVRDLAVARDLAASVDMADPTCPVNNKLDAGPTTKFAVGEATFFVCSHVYVLRDAGGLYAMSSACTHEGCDVTFAAATHDFECPCHQSLFDFNGAVTMLPAVTPLPHYAVSRDASGHLIVDLGNEVPAATRLSVQD